MGERRGGHAAPEILDCLRKLQSRIGGVRPFSGIFEGRFLKFALNQLSIERDYPLKATKTEFVFCFRKGKCHRKQLYISP
jgi:hypothetical protein